MTDDLRARRLSAFDAAFSHLQKVGEISSLHDWCKKAGVGWSTVNDFLEGKTQVMSDRTYAKLADAIGWSVQRLKGEPEPTALDPLEAEYFSMFRTLSTEEKRKEIKALRARLADDDQQ